MLVGHRLGGQCHRQVGPAVICVIERHHGRFACVRPGDLDRVLDRFRAGVEQRRPLLARAGREPVELFGDRDVPLVRCDHEAGVGEPGRLISNRGDDGRRRVSDGGHRDARTQIDEPITVDVFDDAAEGPRRVHGHGVADPTGDGGALPVDQCLRQRAGYLGGEVAALLEGAQSSLLTAWVRRPTRRGSSLVGSAPIRSKTPAASGGMIGWHGLTQRISSRTLNPGRNGTRPRASAPTDRARTTRSTAADTAERSAVGAAPHRRTAVSGPPTRP